MRIPLSFEHSVGNGCASSKPIMRALSLREREKQDRTKMHGGGGGGGAGGGVGGGQRAILKCAPFRSTKMSQYCSIN